MVVVMLLLLHVWLTVTDKLGDADAMFGTETRKNILF